MRDLTLSCMCVFSCVQVVHGRLYTKLPYVFFLCATIGKAERSVVSVVSAVSCYIMTNIARTYVLY